MKGRLAIVLSEPHICDNLSRLTSLGNPRGKRSSSRTDSRSKHGGGVLTVLRSCLRCIQRRRGRSRSEADRGKFVVKYVTSAREKKGRGRGKAFFLSRLLQVPFVLSIIFKSWDLQSYFYQLFLSWIYMFTI